MPMYELQPNLGLGLEAGYTGSKTGETKEAGDRADGTTGDKETGLRHGKNQATRKLDKYRKWLEAL